MDITIRVDDLTPKAFELLSALLDSMRAPAPVGTTAALPTVPAPAMVPADDPEIWTTEDVCQRMGLSTSGIAYGLKAGLLPKPFTRPRQIRKWRAADWRAWQERNASTKYATVTKELTL